MLFGFSASVCISSSRSCSRTRVGLVEERCHAYLPPPSSVPVCPKWQYRCTACENHHHTQLPLGRAYSSRTRCRLSIQSRAYAYAQVSTHFLHPRRVGWEMGHAYLPRRSPFAQSGNISASHPASLRKPHTHTHPPRRLRRSHLPPPPFHEWQPIGPSRRCSVCSVYGLGNAKFPRAHVRDRQSQRMRLAGSHTALRRVDLFCIWMWGGARQSVPIWCHGAEPGNGGGLGRVVGRHATER
jgi:hypothetical protein